MGKESKKTKEKLRLHWNCHQTTPLVNGYTINPSMGTKSREGVVGTRWHGAVKLLIADCVN